MIFDIIFISYDEENADENFEKLLEIAPHAQRVHGVKGIAQAHIAASKLVSTSHFYTVDADNIVNDDFDWEKVTFFQNNDQRVHVWPCLNPVNGLRYGYGGVKLWPTNHIENIKEYSIDFTTSVATHGFKLHADVASITHYNITSFNAWKSGFREATKLASGVMSDKRTAKRLEIWTSVGRDAEFGNECIAGARAGQLFAIEHGDEPENIAKINDFDWLFERFEMKFDDMSRDEIRSHLRGHNVVPLEFDPTQSIAIKGWLNGI